MSAVDTTAADQTLNQTLLCQGSEKLGQFFEKLDTLRNDIEAQGKAVDPTMSRQFTNLARKIDKFEASVTLVGQVKAGKTALTNVLSGNVALLPSDVNPWTSVVTSVHLNARAASSRTRAAFKFFDDSEWDAMVKGGGRLGELARRAGSEDDLEKLRQQVAEMRQTARERLGGKFEALLGKTHKYGYVDAELMERYVCLGDPDELEENPTSQQGRFSDLTKSADIWLDIPEFKGALMIRDTPGVNDTFMVREQITIRALRGSKICVVVLSANEALNTTDLALVRLISNYDDRQVILFVNRIDELPHPGTQVPEILGSIRTTLRSYPSLKDVTVVFGSARWAEMALTSDYSGMDEEAVAALADWSKNSGFARERNRDSFVWKLSGIPTLMEAVSDCIVDQYGQRHLEKVEAALQNLTADLETKDALAEMAQTAQPMVNLDVPKLRRDVGDMRKEISAELDALMTDLRDREFLPVLDQIKQAHVEEARQELLAAFVDKSAQEEWVYDAAPLRGRLRRAYEEFGESISRKVAAQYEDAAARFTTIYQDRLGIEIADFAFNAPPAPDVPPPVVLGKTIAIDLSSNWWGRWWQRRRNIKTNAEDYATLVDAEIQTMIDDLCNSQVDDLFADFRAVLDKFLDERCSAIFEFVCMAPMLASKTVSKTTRAADFKALYRRALDLTAVE
ncbi:dynamin family protein [Cognatiyoonia sp. IB215182]|uniref:dynamin family protein n=1 Tax=Cognatiyoonia sp. IB215182 TaxID=3097353 RepID=UPI002A1765D5|nr:dynamin family protein [Cognatiyoonia sp. IB215182]MDX8354918.1 dynamin family protein [Cognatiyoonia sp. IB215182]